MSTCLLVCFHSLFCTMGKVWFLEVGPLPSLSLEVGPRKSS